MYVLIKGFFDECRYNAYQAYGQSKTGDILLARMIGQQLKVRINHFFHRGLVCNMSHNCYVNDCCCSLSCAVGALVFSSGSCLGVGCEAHKRYLGGKNNGTM
jgi:hypothetical protein